MEAKKCGTIGENIAAQFLKSRGYELIKNNFAVPGGEIDLIAKKMGCIVFVEVKTRTNKAFGEGSEAVTKLKKHRLMRAINRYLAGVVSEVDWRVDVIVVTLHPVTFAVADIEHCEDIEM